MNAGQRLFPILKELVDGRVYQLVRRENAKPILPYIVYQPISSVPENYIGGYTGHESVRIQIDIYHNNYDKLDSLADNVIAMIDRHIKPSEYQGRRQLYESDSDLFRQSIDYEFWTKISPTL